MESSYILENFKNRSSQNNLVQKHFFLADSNWIEQISEIPYGRALFGRRTIWGEPFFCEEHFEESTIRAQSTLRRTLLDRRAVRGDHQLIRELFLESTFCADSTLWRTQFFLQMNNFFLKGRTICHYGQGQDILIVFFRTHWNEDYFYI